MMTTGAGGPARAIARVLSRDPPRGLAPDPVPGPSWSVRFSASVGGLILVRRLRLLRNGLPRRRRRLRLLPPVIGEIRPAHRGAGVLDIGVLLLIRLRPGIVALARAQIDASLLVVLLRRRSVLLLR